MLDQPDQAYTILAPESSTSNQETPPYGGRAAHLVLHLQTGSCPVHVAHGLHPGVLPAAVLPVAELPFAELPDAKSPALLAVRPIVQEHTQAAAAEVPHPAHSIRTRTLEAEPNVPPKQSAIPRCEHSEHLGRNLSEPVEFFPVAL
jgi:hypothetical protein